MYVQEILIYLRINRYTYSQNAVPNELILHLAPFPHGFGLQDEKPENEKKKILESWLI